MSYTSRYWRTFVNCESCGKRVRRSALFPNANTKVRPKPSLKERYKYCISCYYKRSNNGRKKKGGKK